MISSILDLVFLPFTFEPVILACSFVLVVGVFGLVRRFLIRDFSFR